MEIVKIKDFIIKNIPIFILLCLGIYTIVSVIDICQYHCLLHHDQTIFYKRQFLYPEHGRYISTALTNFFIEKLPYLVNMHPNDLFPTYIAYIEAIITFFIFISISFGGFVFSKKRNISFSFLLIYISLFFVLLRNVLSFIQFISLGEICIFLEYITNVIPYCIMFYMISYYFVRNRLPDWKKLTGLLIIVFITGISVDCILITTFITLSLLFLFQILQFIKERKIKLKNKKILKRRLLTFLSIYAIYIISLLCYYRKHQYQPLLDNIELGKNIPEFLNYTLPVLKSSVLLFGLPVFIVTVIAIILILSIKYKRTHADIKMVKFSVSSLIAIYFFYCIISMIFQYIKPTYGFYFLTIDKFQFPFIVMLVFNCFITLGYLIDTRLKYKYAEGLKILLAIIAIIILYKPIIQNHYKEVLEYNKTNKEQRYTLYLYEKTILQQRENEVIKLPPVEVFPYYYYNDWRYNDLIYAMKNIYTPHLDKVKKIIITENAPIAKITSEEEKQLEFSKLLIGKINSNKNSNYLNDIDVEIEKN